MFWLPLIGALAGGLKHVAVDMPARKKAQKLKAETTRYSPWTGIDPNTVAIPETNAMGSVLSLAKAGYDLDQAIDNRSLWKNLVKSETNLNNSMAGKNPIKTVSELGSQTTTDPLAVNTGVQAAQQVVTPPVPARRVGPKKLLPMSTKYFWSPGAQQQNNPWLLNNL